LKTFVHRLTTKILKFRHARASSYAKNTHVYNLFSRQIYDLIDKDNLRNRRRQSSEMIHTRLMIGDPLHVRSIKPRGATTREAARRVSFSRGLSDWHNPEFQKGVVERIRLSVEAAGRCFGIGPEAFGWLARP